MSVVGGENHVGWHVLLLIKTGEVPEWLIGTVSKTVSRLKSGRGFESHPLRQCIK